MTVGSATCELCCLMSSYEWEVNSSFKVPLFGVIIRLMTFVSALFWLRALGKTRSSTLDIYYTILLTALADFFSLLVLRLVPFSDTGTAATVYEVLNILTLGLQWWIQLVVPLFIHRSTPHTTPEAEPLLPPSPGLRALSSSPPPPPLARDYASPSDSLEDAAVWARNVAGVLAIGFIVLTLVGYFAGHPHAGTVPTEGLLATGFFIVWLAQYAAPGSPIRRKLGMRETGKPWLVFLALSHTLFCITYALQSASHGPALETGYCTNLISLLFYYLLFAPMLYHVLVTDSQALRDALLLPIPGFHPSLTASNPSLEAGTHDPSDGGGGESQDQTGLVALASNLRRIEASSLVTAELLGTGQYAEVYRAVWRGVSVAYKRLKPVAASKAGQQVEALVKEAVLLDQLVHPNVVQLLGLVVTPGSLGMVTEFMERGSLFDIISHMRTAGEEAFDEQIASGILLDIARGMLFLHTSDPPVIHRDLKSQNILISSAWRAKVADFGVSRVKFVTGPMTVTGTPQWMAPEVITGEPYSVSADVFSFAILVWEVMHVDHPYTGEAVMALVAQIVDQRRRPPIDDAKAVGPTREIMETGWQDSPMLRPTFVDLVAMLEAW